MAQTLNPTPLRLQVHLQDYAGAEEWLLRKAAKLTEKVYRSANIQIEWIDCTPAVQGRSAAARCREQLRSSTLMVQFLSRKMSDGVPVSKGVYGYAIPAANRAGLFYGRIEDYCSAHGLEARALLGMAMAHEIGHLLLGEGSHGNTGLMSCPWRKKDIVDAARGRLSFSGRQMTLIQLAVLARLEDDKSAAAWTAD